MGRCLVTGGSGFIGRRLVEKLLLNGLDVTVLLRYPKAARAQERIESWKSECIARGNSGELTVLQGDISSEIVCDHRYSFSDYDHIYHLAAIYDLSANDDSVVETNVIGTENLFNRLIKDGFKGVVHFTSSIAVAGDYRGVFTEDMFEEGQSHPHIYNRSKYESEVCVRRYREKHGLDVRIYRPSAVVGHSLTGEMDKIDGPYYLFLLASFFKRWLPRWTPLALPKLEGTLDVVPVDYVVDGIFCLSQKDDLNGRYCFHLTNPKSPSMDYLFKSILKAADAPKIRVSIPFGGLKKAGIGLKQLSMLNELKAFRIIQEQVFNRLGLPESVFSAMMPDVTFNADATLSLLQSDNVAPPKFEDIVDVLWDYYNRHLDPEKNREMIARLCFQGKTVIITGGSSGIGLASAQCAFDYGANVLLVARHQDKLKEAADYLIGQNPESVGTVDTYVCDIANLDECDRLIKFVADKYDGVDIFFSNAGRSIRRSISKSDGRFHDLERTMQLNYFGAARLTLGILPLMVSQGGGQILHSSSMGTMAATPRFGPYMASKAAMDTLMDSMAAEYTNQGISFTSIKFPLVKTNMVAPTSEYKDADLVSPDKAAQMFVDAVIDKPRKQLSGLGLFLGTMSLYAPEVVTQIYNYLYQVWPDEKGEYPEMVFDRALLTSFVPHSPL